MIKFFLAGASPCGHGEEAIEDKGLNVKVSMDYAE